METIIDEKIKVVESRPGPYIGKNEDTFLNTLHDINMAVQIFIHKYQTTHQVTIHEYALERAVVEGSYFVSGIILLNFVFQKVDQSQPQPFRSSVILKVPQLGTFPEYGRHMMLYSKERYVYETIIPLMYESWQYEKVVLNQYASTDSGTLVLENLRECGFYQVPKSSLLSFSVARVVLKSLAQFHALSVCQMDKIRTNLDSLTLMDISNTEWASRIFSSNVKKLHKYVLPHCSELTRRLFDEYTDNKSNIFEMELLPSKDGFNVILQGDLHLYNILLRNDVCDNVEQCKLIDFQFSRRGSPILDIMTFLVTSVDFETFETYSRALFECYLVEFENTRILNKAEVGRGNPVLYGLNELLADFQKYRFCFLYPLICLVPIFWAGQREFSSFNEENDIDTVLKSEKYISFFKGWASYLLCKG